MRVAPGGQVTMPLIREILLAEGPMSIHELYLRLKVELGALGRRVPTYGSVRISVYKLKRRGLVEVVRTEPTWRGEVRLADKTLIQVVDGENMVVWEKFWSGL